MGSKRWMDKMAAIRLGRGGGGRTKIKRVKTYDTEGEIEREVRRTVKILKIQCVSSDGGDEQTRGRDEGGAQARGHTADDARGAYRATGRGGRKRCTDRRKAERRGWEKWGWRKREEDRWHVGWGGTGLRMKRCRWR